MVEITKFERLIQIGEFESVKNYWNSLTTKNKLAIAKKKKKERTATGYTSKGENVLDTIAIFSCIL